MWLFGIPFHKSIPFYNLESASTLVRAVGTKGSWSVFSSETVSVDPKKNGLTWRGVAWCGLTMLLEPN